ncbi:hypothetical protein AK51_08900 [Serratia nematodiphila DZ0503SBS1]|nr:hypothetical protein AK51_08900 [Serratia nematodiphila DZ0503SBS1]
MQHELRRSLSSLNPQRKGRAYLSVPVDMQKKTAFGDRRDQPERVPQHREAAVDVQAVEQLLHDYLLRGLNVACLVGNRMNNPQDAALLLRVAENTACLSPRRCPARARFPKGMPWH